MKKILIISIALAALLAPATASAKPHHSLSYRVQRLEHRLRIAMNIIDAQQERIDDLSHDQRCTSYVHVQFSGFQFPGLDTPVGMFTFSQDDDASQFQLPYVGTDCMESDG